MKNDKSKMSAIAEKLKGKGFLIALLVSLSAVGIATYVSYNSAISKITDFEGLGVTSSDNVFLSPDLSQNSPVGKNETNIPKDDKAVAPQTSETSEAAPANNFVQAKVASRMPIQGEVINQFSNGELVKSKTLDLWKTHDGVDIAANVGDEVVSMNVGTITEIVNDPLWGICVTIDHNDGLVGVYSNLAENVAVATGQVIEAGQLIGYVGESADIESLEPSHLHFAVKKNGSWIDPLSCCSDYSVAENAANIEGEAAQDVLANNSLTEDDNAVDAAVVDPQDFSDNNQSAIQQAE